MYIFDNFSEHNSLAKDALTVTKMNIGPGGKNTPNMHDTVIPADNPHGFGGEVQTMQFDKHLPKNHPHKKLGNDRGMGNTVCFRPGVCWGTGAVLRFDTRTLTITSRGFYVVFGHTPDM